MRNIHPARKRMMRQMATALLVGVAPVVLTAFPAHAATSAEAPATREINRYNLLTMMQIFDGTREFSHTQVVGFGRVRQGSESWIALNYGDGAVVIDRENGMQVGRFRNTSGTEVGMRYNYETHTLTGDGGDVERYHNRYVRPQLGHGPALGRDAKWVSRLKLADLGFNQPALGKMSIILERQYFTWQGKPLVLVRYQVPSFLYRSNGNNIVQWAEGAALSDPGFGEIYWNAALHRAVAQDDGASGRPYRMLKTMGAADEKGKPLLDVRSIPEMAPVLTRFGATDARESLTYAGDGQTTPDQTPLVIAGRLDVMALSLAEDSANQLGEVTGNYINGNRGAEVPAPAPGQPGGIGQTVSQTLEKTINIADNATSILEAADQFMLTKDAGAVLDPDLVKNLVELGKAIDAQKANVNAAIAAAEEAGSLAKEVPAEAYYTPLTSAGSAAQKQVFDAQTALGKAEANLQFAKDMVAAAEAEGASVTQTMRDTVTAQERAVHNAKVTLNDAEFGFARLADEGKAYGSIRLKPDAPSIMAAREREAKILAKKASDLTAAVEKNVQSIMQKAADSLKSTTKLTSTLKWLAESPGGKIIAGVADGLTAWDGISATTNFIDAYRQGDALGSGQLNLSRKYAADGYGTVGGSIFEIVVDLGSLGLNVYTGNWKGALLDAQAITLGSVTDIIISAKSASIARRQATEAELEGSRLRIAAFEQQLNIRINELKTGLADVQYEIEEGIDQHIEDTQSMAQQLLEERQRNREYLEQLAAEEEAARLAEEEAARLAAEEAARNAPPTDEEWDQFNRDIAEAIEPDYPTNIMTPEEIEAARLEREERERLAAEQAEREAQNEAARLAAEEAERQQRAEDLARVQDEAVERREEEKLSRREWLDRAAESGFDISPLTFELPVWDPPKFELPEFVPPEFHAPDPTTFDWTEFAGTQYPGTELNLAFGFEEMSGTVATDLSPYENWLQTQDVRKLEQLARNIGYPNLASALADANNIIANARDAGYRDWANTAPSCGGLVGCGPSYLERWAAKSSMVALGDILNKSRDVFSSGGLTDVGISGLRLSYMLRDHGVEDGDIIDVEITQFGRILYSNRITLTNAGDKFSIPLQRGVAGMTIFAVNEGALPPNTAEVKIDDVVHGEELQRYSLRTNEFATQRIEAGAKGEK